MCEELNNGREINKYIISGVAQVKRDLYQRTQISKSNKKVFEGL